MVHGFGVGGGNPGEPDLPDPARNQFINLFVWIVEANDVAARTSEGPAQVGKAVMEWSGFTAVLVVVVWLDLKQDGCFRLPLPADLL